ncbi:MAG: hypothetical protein FJZ01_02190 [Candidatus Sericytochromatia bacterium]|nr:hypothetical protein [Candidatus Tanganyikabacteria bacterium]
MSDSARIKPGSSSRLVPKGGDTQGKTTKDAKPAADALLLKELGLERLLEPEAEVHQSIAAGLVRDASPDVAAARTAALQKIRDRLLTKASDGRTLGQILAERARDPALAHDVAIVIGQLAGDVPIIQGTGTAACAAAILQTMLAKDSPAEYARVALDLVATGSTRVGKREYRVPADLPDPAGRSEVSLAFQSAFLQAFEGGKEGVQARKLAALYKAFSLRSLVTFDQGATRRALDSGKPVAVVLRRPDGKLHAVLAQKTKEGDFYYDPARGGARFPLDRSRIAGEVSYAAASLKILKEEPKTFSYKTAGLLKEILSAGVGLRGIEDLSPEAQTRLREAATAYNTYLPQDPVGDGSGGVAGAEEVGPWSRPPEYSIVQRASRASTPRYIKHRRDG